MKIIRTDGNDLVHSFDGTATENYKGLTKIEYFSIMLMPSIISSTSEGTMSEFAALAIEGASALIKRLNDE